MARRYTITSHTYPLRPAYTAISRILSTLFQNIYLLVIQFILVFCLVINVIPDVDGSAFVGFLLTLVVPLAAAVLYVVLVWKLEIFVEHILDHTAALTLEFAVREICLTYHLNRVALCVHPSPND